MADIAFIGLGIMGLPMAGHLLTHGHTLRLHTRTKSKAGPLLNRGARWSARPADAAKGADFVFICVPDSPDVRTVLIEPGGVLESTHAGQIIIDHSTIAAHVSTELAKAAAERKAVLLDAPVSGGDSGAKAGALSIMVGGDADSFERVAPLLRCYGKTIVHCGGPGTGQLTKAVNQILVGGTLMAVCEALAFAAKNSLDPKKTLDAVGGGAAGSWQLANLGPRILAGDFRPGFMIDLIQKDLRHVLEAAELSGTSLPGTSLVHQLFTTAQAAGHGREGSQALFKVLQMLASLH